MKKVLTALEGWKLTIGVVALFIVGVYDQMHGGHATTLVTGVLQALGWIPEGGEWTGDAIAKASSSAAVLLGIGGRLYKAQKQIRAGSSVAGALSTEGYLVAHEVALNAGKPEAVKVEEKAQTAVMVAEAGK